MPRTGRSIQLISILLGVLALSTFISPVVALSYDLGVTPGQWAKYKVLTYTCTIPKSICQTLGAGSLEGADYAILQIGSVAGTKVVFTLVSVYMNGSSSRHAVSADVLTGTTNVTSTGGSGTSDYFVLATGLAAKDPIWSTPEAPTLNATKSEIILGGTPKQVNFLNLTSSTLALGYSIVGKSGFAYDQNSGLFIEISIAATLYSSFIRIGDFDLTLAMVDNDIWLASPDYSLSATNTNLSMVGSETGTTQINPNRLNGFSTKINLTQTSSSSNLSCTLSQTSLPTGNSDSSSLSCTGTPGSYTVVVIGNANYIIRSLTIAVNIAPGPDFSISSSRAMNFPAGSSGTSTITITAQNGYDSETNLEVRSSPLGLTCNLSANSVPGHGSVTLSCSGQPGSYIVTVKGTGGGASHSTATTVIVTSTPASVEPASPLPRSLIAGGVLSILVVATLGLVLLRRRSTGSRASSTGPSVPQA